MAYRVKKSKHNTKNITGMHKLTMSSRTSFSVSLPGVLILSSTPELVVVAYSFTSNTIRSLTAVYALN